MKKAISYIRFSSKQQLTGDSSKRQSKLIKSWLDNNPDFQLDEHMQFKDLGISGFSGANAEKGEFGDFLAAVKAGFINPGSVLLCESLDRISREDIDKAGDQLRSILRSGVEIVTLQDGSWYTQESLTDPLSMIKAILIMQRANEESTTKSERVRSGWARLRKNAAEEGKIMSRRCVAWLKVSEDGESFEFVDEHVKAVKRVFQLRIEGMSHIKIASVMNAEGFMTLNQYKPRAGGWSQSTVTDLLSNRSVIGYKVPSKSMKATGVADIPNYYPAIISQEQFYAVQQLKSGSGRKPSSEKPLLTNLFKGVMRCSKCGYMMIVTGVTAKRSGNYRCSVKYTQNCSAKGLSRLQTDKALVQGLLYNTNRLNLTGDNTQAIGKLQSELEGFQKQRERLVKLAMMIDDADSIAEELRSVLIKIKTTEAAISDFHQRDKSSKLDTISHLDLNIKKDRVEAQIIIKRMIKNIFVDTEKKVCKVEFHNGLVFHNFPLDRVVDGARELEIIPILGDSEFDFDGYTLKPRKVMLDEAPQWVRDSDDSY